MGSIYANAEQVLVWLGSKDFAAFDYLEGIEEHRGAQAIFDTIHKTIDLFRSWKPSTQTSGYIQRFLQNLDDHSKYAWSTFAKLMNHTWFTRLWVVQEVGLGKSVLALFGKSSIDFDELMQIAGLLHYDDYLADYFGINIGCWLTFSIFPTRNQNIQDGSSYFADADFLRVLELTSTQLVTVPHDTIYALLGHPAARINGVLIAESDYNKSTSDLFLEVATKLIDSTKSLRVLSAVRHGKESNLEEDSMSWVPKWSRDGFLNFIGIGNKLEIYQDPSDCRSAFWHEISSDRVLRVRGFILDVVDECTRALEFGKDHIRLEDQDADFWPIQAAMTFKSRSAFTVSELLSDMAQTLQIGAGILGQPNNHNVTRSLADFAAFRLYLIEKTFRQHGITTGGLAPEGLPALRATAKGGDPARFFGFAQPACTWRKLFSTSGGILGLGSKLLRKGDICCILFGATVPFILRSVGRRYRLVGEAYIHAFKCDEETNTRFSAEMLRQQNFEIF